MFNIWRDKKRYSIGILYKTRQYFPKTFERSGENVQVELDLSNYATKSDLKGATSVDTCNLAARSDLASLKAEKIRQMYIN